MDRDTFALLLTPVGQAALADAIALAPAEDTFLPCFTRMSKSHSAALAKAALETALLRRRARDRFSRAGAMYFTREALEQASSEVVANHRAQRFAGFGRVGDFCCGIGGDSIGLAAHTEVIAIDRDPLRLAMAEQNLMAYGRCERASFVEADLTQLPFPAVEAFFFDPGRRPGGRRRLSVAEYEPPLEVIERWAVVAAGVKLAPGIDRAELSRYAGEQEFISVAGELKECVLWLGPLRTTANRATLLPAGDTLTADGPLPASRLGTPGEWLYDPDPAVIRAGLVSLLAERLDAWQLDADIAYLAAAEPRPTPFARCYRIEEVLPFHLRRLRDLLRGRQVGRLTVKRRGSPIDPDTLVRQLKLDGPEERILFLTHVAGRPWCLLGR